MLRDQPNLSEVAWMSGVTHVSGSDMEFGGGGGGIRTPETLTGLTVFKTAGFNRSPTPPFLILTYSVG